MFTYKQMLIPLVAFAALGAIVWRYRAVRVQAQARPWRPYWMRIEEKTSDAENSEPERVRALVEEVLGQPFAFGRLPASVIGPLRERVLRAELRYRSGRAPAVGEGDIVRLVNSFADRLVLPDFAKTSEHQVRELRLRSMIYAPKFTGTGMTEREDGSEVRVGDSINPTMSPLQAVHLTMYMVHCKLMGSDYQLAPEEWEAQQYRTGLARSRTAQLSSVPQGWGQPTTTTPAFMSAEDARAFRDVAVREGELTRAFDKAFAGLTAMDFLEMGNSALDELGLQRGDEQ